MLINKNNILPFFKISLAYTIFYLLLLVIIPISHLFYHANQLNIQEIINVISNSRVISAYKLTFGAAALASIINVILGLFISWTIARYDFKGKAIIDVFIDLPIALPTAIAGLSLAHLYATDAWLGSNLAKIGVEVAFSKLGIIIALIFVGLPLSVRTIEPVIRELDGDMEAAAYNLGANSWQVFWRIYMPNFTPAILSAFCISFARGLSEYGAVIFIASNIPKHSEIISLLIYSKIEQFDYNQATAIAVVMLVMAFLILWLINILARKISP